jgi:peroxin-2
VFGRYGWTKWEDFLLDQEGGYEPPTPRIRTLSRFTSSLSTFHNVAAMVSFLTFLFNGQYRTILDRILRLRLVPASSHTRREVSFEYLNRQLVWHAFTEFLLFLLPLVGIARWRRILSRGWKKAVDFTQQLFGQKIDNDESSLKKGGELGFLPERTCAICYSDQNPAVGAAGESEIVAATSTGGGVIGSASTDITNPYEAVPCGCVYCFICIAQRIEGEEGEGWTCLRCGQIILECKAWNGDVLEEQTRSGGTGKSVGFSQDRPYASEPPLTPGLSDVTMKELEPMPTEDDELEPIEEADSYEEPEPAFGATNEANESAEWARAGDAVEESDGSESGSEYNSDEEEDDDHSHREISFERA